MSYNIASGNFTDYGDSYLSDTLGNPVGEEGYGGYFTQMDTTLYTVSYDYPVNHINSYRLDTATVLYEEVIVVPETVSFYSCLASSTTPRPRIYVTGGTWDGTNSVHVLDVGTNDWASTSSMLYGHSRHGCIVLEDMLYVVAGYTVSAVEAMNITNIASPPVEIASLPVDDLYGFGQVVASEAVIYIIGGWSTGTGVAGNQISDRVYALDTATNHIILHSTLETVLAYTAAVVVDRVIYAFGGNHGGLSSDD